VTVGKPVKIGALVVVPRTTAAVGETFACDVPFMPVFRLAKVAGFALAEGEAVYYDYTDERCEAAGEHIGYCATTGGVASAATSVRVAIPATTAHAPGAGLAIIADPGDGGAIPVSQDGCCALSSGAAEETRTIAPPVALGQQLKLSFDQDGGGNIVITVATGLGAGRTTITVGDEGDSVTLVGVAEDGNRRWRPEGNEGCAIA
jgi:predicted RecA/RadA family phage recombinase